MERNTVVHHIRGIVVFLSRNSTPIQCSVYTLRMVFELNETDMDDTQQYRIVATATMMVNPEYWHWIRLIFCLLPLANSIEFYFRFKSVTCICLIVYRSVSHPIKSQPTSASHTVWIQSRQKVEQTNKQRRQKMKIADDEQNEKCENKHCWEMKLAQKPPVPTHTHHDVLKTHSTLHGSQVISIWNVLRIWWLTAMRTAATGTLYPPIFRPCQPKRNWIEHGIIFHFIFA